MVQYASQFFTDSPMPGPVRKSGLTGKTVTFRAIRAIGTDGRVWTKA